jgi:hypothetical protein
MDMGVVAIVVASISTLVGGLIGFLSSFFTNQQALDHSRILATLPKQMESAEFVAMVLFRALSGEKQSEETWNQYISSCFWLPTESRLKCLNVLGHESDGQILKAAQEAVIKHLSKMMKG